MIDWYRLRRHFSPDDIDWRVGATNADKTKGMALAYIDARHVMDRLDEVLGPENWQCRYPHAGNKTVCEIGILIREGSEEGWVWKADGAGDTDVEAAKGALSDALKRAAVRWGIGRYLYSLDSPWVALEQKGRSYVIADSAKSTLVAALKPKHATVSTGLHGPLGITDLKEQGRKLAGDIEACEDLQTLAGVQEGYRDVLTQLRRDLPQWYYGVYDHGLMVSEGADGRIAAKIKELEEKEAGS